MSPTDLGEKHECEDCGTKYYDFGKSNAQCPACGHVEGSESDTDADSKKADSKKKKK